MIVIINTEQLNIYRVKFSQRLNPKTGYMADKKNSVKSF